MGDLRQLTAAVEAMRQLVWDAPPEELPTLVGEIEAIKAAAWVRLQTTNGQPSTAEPEELVDAKVMAKCLSIPVSKVRQAARCGDIPSVPVGRYVRFRPAEVIAALERRANSKVSHLTAITKRTPTRRRVQGTNSL